MTYADKPTWGDLGRILDRMGIEPTLSRMNDAQKVIVAHPDEEIEDAIMKYTDLKTTSKSLTVSAAEARAKLSKLSIADLAALINLGYPALAEGELDRRLMELLP